MGKLADELYEIYDAVSQRDKTKEGWPCKHGHRDDEGHYGTVDKCEECEEQALMILIGRRLVRA